MHRGRQHTGPICAVAVDPASHHVFIGGSFTSISGVPANNVAMWDGKSWHALGQGTDGVVEALLVYGGKLLLAQKRAADRNRGQLGAPTWAATSGVEFWLLKT